MSKALTTTDISSLPVQEPALALIDAFSRNMNSENTRENYRREVRLFYEIVGKNAAEITIHDLIAYKERLEIDGLKPSSIAKKITILKRLFTFLYEQGAIPINPSNGIKAPKVCNESCRDVLTLAEANKLLAAVNTSTLRGKRDKLAIALQLINGLRICELHRANIGDISYREGCWVLRVHGKGGKIIDTRLRQDVKDLINDFLEERKNTKPSDPLFIGTNHLSRERITRRSLQRIVEKYLKKIGINRPNVSSHSLRHSAVSAVIDAGATLLDAMSFARHSSPTVTLRYIHRKNQLQSHAVMVNPISCSAQ